MRRLSHPMPGTIVGQSTSPASPLTAFVAGWLRTWHAPALTLGLLVVVAVVGEVLPPWSAGGGHPAGSLVDTFTFDVLGLGIPGTLAGPLIHGTPLPSDGLTPRITLALAALAGWLFLSGGILDRLARARPVRTAAFFAACGVHGVRFIRLAVSVGVVYWLLFAWLSPRILAPTPLDSTATVLSGLLLALLVLVNVVADYAMVRIVVEDRRSVLGALAAAFRFVRRRPFRVLGLYALSASTTLVIVEFGLRLLPGTAYLIPVFLLGRLWTALAWMAAEVVFFQGELAHTGYVAAPLPMWPDSPAAEALENLVSRQ